MFQCRLRKAELSDMQQSGIISEFQLINSNIVNKQSETGSVIKNFLKIMRTLT